MKSKSSVIAIEILSDKQKSFHQSLNICIDRNLISDKILRLFSVYCYKLTLQWVDNPKFVYTNAVNIAEKYALGQSDDISLKNARLDAENCDSSETRIGLTPLNFSWSNRTAIVTTNPIASDAARNASNLCLISISENYKNRDNKISIEKEIEEKQRKQLIEMLKI